MTHTCSQCLFLLGISRTLHKPKRSEFVAAHTYDDDYDADDDDGGDGDDGDGDADDANDDDDIDDVPDDGDDEFLDNDCNGISKSFFDGYRMWWPSGENKLRLQVW